VNYDSRLTWVCVTVLLVMVSVLPSQAVRSLDDEDLQKLVRELRPTVEKVCGRKFAREPVAFVADSGDMMRVFRVELEPQLAEIYKGQPASRIRRALQLRADLLGLGVIGKYELASGEVLIVPGRVAQNLKVLGLTDLDEWSVLKLFLAHELVHALQGQEIDFGKRYAEITQTDLIHSLVMRTEGHAVMCSEMVMGELGLIPAIDAGRAVLRGTTKELEGLGSLLAGRATRCRPALLYLSGADLLYDEFERGGMDQVWKVLKSDRQLTQLLRPRTKLRPIAYHQKCFEGIGDRFGGRTWCVGSAALSEIDRLSENYSAREEALAALGECVAGADWNGNSGTPLAWRTASAMRFRTTAAATKYRELAERCAVSDLRLATNRMQLVANPGPAIEGCVSRVLRQVQPGNAKMRRMLQPGNAKAQVNWFQRDECLVQLTLVRAPLADDVLVSVATDVLAALAQ
jgi:hypothetical protein